MDERKARLESKRLPPQPKMLQFRVAMHAKIGSFIPPLPAYGLPGTLARHWRFNAKLPKQSLWA